MLLSAHHAAATMTFLSLFMTSTGIFCFVPISRRLIESGIVPPSNNWWFRGLPGAITPMFYDRKDDRLAFLLANDEAEDAWADVTIPLFSAEAPDTLAADQQLATPCTSEWCPAIVSPHQSSPTPSHITSFYGDESTSFATESTICNSCDALLRREIPPDHIPSVIRALALFQAQDRLCDIIYEEYEMAALTDAFSMLQL